MGDLGAIPGLEDEDDTSSKFDYHISHRKKVPYAKPVPRSFEAAWTSGVQPTSMEAEQADMMKQHRDRPGDRGSRRDQDQGPRSRRKSLKMYLQIILQAFSCDMQVHTATHFCLKCNGV